MVCGTIVVEHTSTKKRRASPAEVILDRIASALYERCRLKTFDVSGFPDFGPLLAELSESQASDAAAGAADSFKVSTLHPSGSLIIQEQFFHQFQESEELSAEFGQIVEDHNAKYNAENLRLPERTSPSKSSKPEELVKAELLMPAGDLTHETIASLPNASGPQIQPINSRCQNLIIIYNV